MFTFPLRRFLFRELFSVVSTTDEWLIGSLCLENVARARGLLNQREKPLEWLNLEAIAIRTIADININSWRTSSMDSNVEGQEGNKEQEPDLTGSNNNPDEGREGTKNKSQVSLDLITTLLKVKRRIKNKSQI